MKGYQRKLAQEILEFKALKEKYLKGPSTPGDATDDLEKAPDPLWDLSGLLPPILCLVSTFLPSSWSSISPINPRMPSFDSWKLRLVSACQKAG